MQSSDAQFGFKLKHSTSQCTFVAEETIQHYVKGGSSVYVMLLDASEAFDIIEYVKLFKILLDRGLCPLVCRLIYSLYLNQNIRIKWGNSLSQLVFSGNKRSKTRCCFYLLFFLVFIYTFQ